MARHPELRLRSPQNTSANRIKAFCKENVDKFFANLLAIYDRIPFDSRSIYNMDETGFSTVPTKYGKVIALRGMRRVGQMVAAERGTLVTMAYAVNAAGGDIPPFFLFPRKNMQATFLDNVTDGTSGFANESGWMQQQEFVRYMRHFIRFSRASIQTPVLMKLYVLTLLFAVTALKINEFSYSYFFGYYINII